MCIALAPAHKNQLANYTEWLRKLNLDFKILKPGETLENYTMLILCGGPDVGSSPVRDIEETQWFNYAYGKIPILGICRGMQLANILRGGTLVEDLSDDKIKHSSNKVSIANEPSPLLESSWHTIKYKDNTIKVNSRHHQGVDILGNGLNVIACCLDDNLPEMLEGDKSLFVQWHPERLEIWDSEAEQIVSDWVKTNYVESTLSQKILNHMNRNNFTSISIETIMKVVDKTCSYSMIDNLINENSQFKYVVNKNGKKAIKKLQ